MVPAMGEYTGIEMLIWVTIGISMLISARAEPAPSSSDTKCRISEYPCNNRRCVPINRFCDNVNDCGDSSDEPRHCTPCNRTYYGDLMRTYDMELHRPKEDRLPFICHITITAAGGSHGDLIQLTLDSFTIGRFVSFTLDGCPDGALQISELGRPAVGGSWCGTSWGPSVYYSETRSITLYVRLLRLSKDHTGYNFDFRMQYKVLHKGSATVRYGGTPPPVSVLLGEMANTSRPLDPMMGELPPLFMPTMPPLLPPSPPPREYYLGDLISGTYCSRIFSDCDRKLCRLQSPNFPGVYPRNLTCYYAVRQHEVPPGKHALITVRQTKGQLISIRSQAAVYAPQQQQQQQNTPTRTLRVWNECDDVQDYVTIYDGYTTRDPVILKFCGGGEAVPESVSSGPELLVEFTTSPYGTFMNPVPIQSLHGFQLEVDVKFVDQKSPTYARNKRACEFWIRGTGKGVLESPQHSLSPNTTCLYHLQGIDTSLDPAQGPRTLSSYPWRRQGFYPPPRFRVWLSVLKFHIISALEPQLPEEELCASHLNVWDGPLRIAPGCSDIFCDREKWKASKSLASVETGQPITVGKPPGNATLLARYCRDRVPRSCDHSLLTANTRVPRPCALAESFLTTGDSMTLELRLADSTALKPVTFKALYEFVDLQQDGEAFGTGPCSRRFLSRSTEASPEPKQRFSAPRDVFLYGRGGAKNLSCTYRFEAQRGERIRITINSLKANRKKQLNSTTMPWNPPPPGFISGRCLTRESARGSRLACIGRPRAALSIYEVPWSGASPLIRDCLCSNPPTGFPYVFVSSEHVVEVTFQALNMSASDDFSNMFFEGTYEFIRAPGCDRNQKVHGASGELQLRLPGVTHEEMSCENHPWLIEPSLGRYLYVQVKGTHIRDPVYDELYSLSNITQIRDDSAMCLTRNRIAIYPGSLPPIVICPMPPYHQRHHVVEVFSEGWNLRHDMVDLGLLTSTAHIDRLGKEHSRSVAVEFLGRDYGAYSVMWLELTRRRYNTFPAVYAMSEVCKYRCPELDACVNASVWCDGISQCPSGYDESITHCSLIFQLPSQYLAALCALLLSGVSIAIFYLMKNRKRKRSSALQRRLESMSSDTAVFGDKEVIC